MFDYILCETETIDIVITIIVMLGLFIADMVFTSLNLYNLKRLYPKTYLKFEQNILLKLLVKKLGFKKGLILSVILFTILYVVLGFWILFPSLIIGFFICMVFFIHYPNYIEIKERLKKSDKLKKSTKRNSR